MLLCIVPLLSVAFLFIAHSVIIAFQMRDVAAAAYEAALIDADAPELVLQAAKNVSPDMGWITQQWVGVFVALFVCFYIPITINIGRFIKPIRKLADYSNKLSVGDVNIEVIKDRTDEIGILQQGFQKLVSSSREQADLIKHIADGDLSMTYNPRSDEDVVGHSIVRMLELNNALISQLVVATQEIALGSSQVADGSQDLASGATQQSAAIDQLAMAVKGVAQIPNDNMRMAEKAGDIAGAVIKNAEDGNRMMAQMVNAVMDIRNASVNVQKVVKVIDDIAFQTNILALNAAVEAARAGQQGKGFAVVAEEVRNLATKSAVAAKDTDELILDAMKRADLGVQIADETATSFQSILSGLGETNQIVQEISKSSKEQDVSISGISESINQMSQVVLRNSAAAEEYAASSEGMNNQAETLQQLVSQFKIRDVPKKLAGSHALLPDMNR